MKKRFYLSAFLFIATFLFSVNLNAQYCGGSGPSVCTPVGGITLQGFYPPYDSLPCIQPGVYYDQIIQLHTPTTANAPIVGIVPLNWVQIDTIGNLPCGLCWRTGATNNRINGNSTGCIRVTGTTYDAPGQYKLRIIVTANVQTFLGPITQANNNGDSIGVKYWGRVENLNGTCITIDTLAVGNTAHTAGSAPAITLAGTTSVCTGGSSTFSISNAVSYYAYEWSTGATTSSINVSTGGTYTVTAYAACSSVTASRTLTVNANPTPTITPSGPSTFCSGGSVTLDAGNYNSWLWSTNATSQSINVSQGGTYTVTVTQNGCSGTSNTVTVTVNSNPAPTVTAGGATTFCTGGSVSLDAGAGYTGYTWSNTETTQTISATQSGNYNVTVTQNGCSGTSNTITVTVNSNPSPIVNVNGPITFCAGGSITLDAGPGYSSYSWSSGEITQSIVVTQSGTYMCTVTQNGCSGPSNAVTVTVNAIPTPVITPWGPTTFCLGGDVWLEPGPGYSSYSWSNGETTQAIYAHESGAYTLTVTLNGCSGTSNTITVTEIDPTPTVTANGPTTFCTGGSVTLDAGAGFQSYDWSDGGTSRTTVVTQSGSYTVTTSISGCVGTSSPLTVTVTANNLAPVITATPSLNICPGGSATLDAGVGYTTYAWSTTSSNQSITENTAATYTVTVTQGTCSGTASATLNVGNFAVAVDISPAGPVSACTGDVVVLDANATYDSYAWSNSDVTQTTSVTASGTYILTVTSNSCEGTDTVEVTFDSALQPAISPAGPVSACAGETVVLDAGGVYSTYAWSNGDGTSSTGVTISGTYILTVSSGTCFGSDTVEVTFNANPVVAVSPAGHVTVCAGTAVTLDAGVGFAGYSWSNGDITQTTQPASSGTFVVTVLQNGCEGTDTVEVTINPIPQPAVTPAGPVSACVGDNVVLDAGTGFSSYSWSNGDLTQTTQPTSSASYIVNVTQNGCSGSDTVDVTFNGIPHATISPSGTQTICSGNSVTLDAGAGFGTYQWTGNATTQTINVTSVGTYDVTVTQNGCSGSSTNPVAVVVNATPNASITVNVLQNEWSVFTAVPVNGASYLWQQANDTVSGTPVNRLASGNTDTLSCADVTQGYVRVIVSSANCSDTSGYVMAPICVGINHLATELKFSMMPNPVSDVLNVSYDLKKASNVTISILDITGRKLMNVLNETQNTGEHRESIQLNDISSGIYLLSFNTEFGSLNTKFVKE